MPTASRFIGAIFFAAIAFYVSELFKLQMPEGRNFGNFSFYNAAIGLICGWVFLRLPRGLRMSSSIGHGLSAMAAVLFWVVLINCISEMLRLSLRKQYDGPLEAILGVFKLALEYGQLLGTTEIISVMLIGGVVGGIICGWAAHKWP